MAAMGSHYYTGRNAGQMKNGNTPRLKNLQNILHEETGERCPAKPISRARVRRFLKNRGGNDGTKVVEA